MPRWLEVVDEDGEAIIHWLVRQSWCSGQVGMIGISWGGFNGLQIAECQPEPLKAIITACSTNDRYTDDIHYMGGYLLADNLSWASTMYSHNALPPDPLLKKNLRRHWHERMEGSGYWLEAWLAHKRRDSYWRHGSAESATTMIQPRDYAWTVTRDLAHDRSVLEIRKDKGEVRIDELDLDVRIRTVEWYSHSGNDYDSIRYKTENVRRLCRDDWSVTVRARTVLTSDAGHFYLRAELASYEGDRRVHSHNIEKKIDRDLV